MNQHRADSPSATTPKSLPKTSSHYATGRLLMGDRIERFRLSVLVAARGKRPLAQPLSFWDHDRAHHRDNRYRQVYFKNPADSNESSGVLRHLPSQGASCTK